MTLSKEQYIAQMFPNYKDVDVRFDSIFVHKVSRSLYEAKFYLKWHESIEPVTMNVILKMQGKYKRNSHRCTRIVNRDKI